MNQDADVNDRSPGTEGAWAFPRRRLYFFVVGLLAFFSLFVVSIQPGDPSTKALKFSAEIKITTITLVLLLLAWLPLLLPWLPSIAPALRRFFSELRQSGIKHIKAGPVEIQLSPEVEKAAAVYESKVNEVSKAASASANVAGNIENLYQATMQAIEQTEKPSPQEALELVDQLGTSYNRLRESMPSGPQRTARMNSIASKMFALIPGVENFPVRERINSANAGQRLSAYKYLEYKPNSQYLDPLLSRAIGILEAPHGQFHALLALRRLASSVALPPEQSDQVAKVLAWASALPYMSRDRLGMMKNISGLMGG